VLLQQKRLKPSIIIHCHKQSTTSSFLWRPSTLYKYIIIVPIALFWPLSSFGTLPAICDDPNFVCKEAGPGFVNLYPVSQNGDKNQQNEYSRKEQTSAQANSKDGTIEVDLENLTWVAYDYHGDIIRSGHVSGGKDYCSDIKQDCRTVTGTFTIYRKGDDDCKSTKFPIGRGGAPMPYCMFFHDGYALHGSSYVPDYNASHGCVRMEPDDAQWLNENFVEVGRTQIHIH
jgi:hypothetical protein